MNAPMTTLRLDHVSVVVSDLDAAVAFFAELGLSSAGDAHIEGPWVDRINNIEGIDVDIVMLTTPDGHGKLELTRFQHPGAVAAGREDVPNTLGLRSIMFEVADVADTVERLYRHGGELIGEIVDYENTYRLCYLRGPDGVIVALAQPLTHSDG